MKCDHEIHMKLMWRVHVDIFRNISQQTQNMNFIWNSYGLSIKNHMKFMRKVHMNFLWKFVRTVHTNFTWNSWCFHIKKSLPLKEAFIRISYEAFIRISYEAFVRISYEAFVRISYGTFVRISYGAFVWISYRAFVWISYESFSTIYISISYQIHLNFKKTPRLHDLQSLQLKRCKNSHNQREKICESWSWRFFMKFQWIWYEMLM